jgi:hypothetical protein
MSDDNSKKERRAKKAEQEAAVKESKENLQFFKKNDKKVDDDIIDQLRKLLIEDHEMQRGTNNKLNGDPIMMRNRFMFIKLYGNIGKLTDDSSGETKLFTEDHVKNVYKLLLEDNRIHIHWDGRTKYDHLDAADEEDFRKNYVHVLITTHHVFLSPNNMSSKAEAAYKALYTHLKENLQQWLTYLGWNNGVW